MTQARRCFRVAAGALISVAGLYPAAAWGQWRTPTVRVMVKLNPDYFEGELKPSERTAFDSAATQHAVTWLSSRPQLRFLVFQGTAAADYLLELTIARYVGLEPDRQKEVGFWVTLTGESIAKRSGYWTPFRLRDHSGEGSGTWRVLAEEVRTVLQTRVTEAQVNKLISGPNVDDPEDDWFGLIPIVRGGDVDRVRRRVQDARLLWQIQEGEPPMCVGHGSVVRVEHTVTETVFDKIYESPAPVDADVKHADPEGFVAEAQQNQQHLDTLTKSLDVSVDAVYIIKYLYGGAFCEAPRDGRSQ